MAAQKLTRNQFDILTFWEENPNAPAETLPEATGLSAETAAATVSQLETLGYLAHNTVTPQGLDTLEPYRAKRAIFIAAGFGSRMVPITLNTPKPLVRVHGTRIIDTLLDAVIAAGIQEIYIVRGYLGEQFDQLLYKYPMVRFLDNPLYSKANNLSSAYLARHLLQNAYVLEADLVLYNPKLISKYQFASNYLGVPVASTNDWAFDTDNGVITKLHPKGSTNTNHLFGISYWDAEAGTRLADDIEQVFGMPDGNQLYWDQVPLERCLAHYRIEGRACTFQDITEIDSFEELKKLDSAYC